MTNNDSNIAITRVRLNLYSNLLDSNSVFLDTILIPPAAEAPITKQSAGGSKLKATGER